VTPADLAIFPALAVVAFFACLVLLYRWQQHRTRPERDYNPVPPGSLAEWRARCQASQARSDARRK
jgi:hypothetical protein